MAATPATPRGTRLDVGRLLAAVEAAAPVEAAGVLSTELARLMGAREVSFLIADFSGRSLIRLSHTAPSASPGADGREVAQHVALWGTPQGRAVTDQAVQ